MARYSAVEADLVARGLLRTDGGGPDAPFDAMLLAENFTRVALYNEFVPVSGQLVARETQSRLRRWETPVRVRLSFGRSVTETQRDEDIATVRSLTDTLTKASGHPVSYVTSDANFNVLVVNDDERRVLGTTLRSIVPGISDQVIQTVETLPPSIFCLVIAFSSDEAPYTYVEAISIVRAEHPRLLRQSCFHEEITQGLGLANDSPAARPSIFNDDEEFALLTEQDRLMLKILYDPRLQPGMTLETALPLVMQIADELLPGRVTALQTEAQPTPGDQ